MAGFFGVEPPRNGLDLARVIVRFALVILFTIVAVGTLYAIGQPRAAITVGEGIGDFVICLMIIVALLFI